MMEEVNGITLTVGQLIGIITLVTTIVSAVIAVSIKVYKHMNKWRLAKNKIETKEKTLENHTKEISEIKKEIDKLLEFNDRMIEINKIQTRHALVRACTEAISQKFITESQLQSLEDMYELYTNILNGNSYVLTLMKKVRQLDVVPDLSIIEEQFKK